MINKFNHRFITECNYPPRRSFIQSFWKVNGAITLALSALVLTTACESEETKVAVPVPAEPVAEAPVAPEVTAPGAAVPGAPVAPGAATPAANLPTGAAPVAPEAAVIPNANLLGENVTVSTKVQEVINPNLFVAYDKESLRGQPILVVSKQPAPAVGTNIELTGVVRNFVAAEVNKEYGLTLEPNVVEPYVGKPYVAAAAIEKVD